MGNNERFTLALFCQELANGLKRSVGVICVWKWLEYRSLLYNYKTSKESSINIFFHVIALLFH